MADTKKWGIIDLNGGIWRPRVNPKGIQRRGCLLSTEGDILKSCVFLHRYPESPLLPVSFEESTIDAIYKEIENIIEKHKDTHKCLIYFKSANYFYHLWSGKPENSDLFKKELASLHWTILACKQWKNKGLIEKWVIETEARLYLALHPMIKDMVFSQEYNQVSFGIPQNKKLCILVEDPIFIHTNKNEVPKSWAQILDMPPKETTMFSSRYDRADIIKFGKLGRIPGMDIRSGYEIPFEFLSNDEHLIAMGDGENFALAPLTAGQIGKLYGFDLDYLDVPFILEKEKRSLILTSKWPQVCRKILESFCGLNAVEKIKDKSKLEEEEIIKNEEDREETFFS